MAIRLYGRPMHLSADQPFILLDDARAEGAGPARFYRAPTEIISATRIEDVAPALDRLARASREGRHVAGFLAYEAGATFEPRLGDMATAPGPLLWFGLFDGFETIAPDAVEPLFANAAEGQAGAIRPEIDEAGYARAFDRVKARIEAGDIYQANLTFRSSVPVSGDPIGLYRALRDRGGAGHGALVWTGDDWLLSFSPELFFALDGGQLLARPMKGTAVRGASPKEDRALAADLATDPKQRAENLMIVDLLRNDLARVAEAGSVDVARLFAVETYPTVHQLVSDVTATLRQGCDAYDVLRATFPCGSVTGAPKIRAMEIIAEVEMGPRGIYTGSIGRIDPNGDALFNVAIRTLSWPNGADEAVLGLGSGVVADSLCDAEWQECLDKGRFLKA